MRSRREFLGDSILLPLAVATAAEPQPVRIAIVTTVYKYLSHGQHISDRFLVGYPHNGAWHTPNVKVVSLYVDQKSKDDLSEERAREFGFRVHPTIAEALCCGGNRLACDAVLTVDEHGDYSRNEKARLCIRATNSSSSVSKCFEIAAAPCLPAGVASPD